MLHRRFLVIGLVAVCALLAGCLSAGPGGCDSENRAFFATIEQFDGISVEPEGHPYGICGASFTTREPVESVAEHYRAAFEAAGWEVGPPENTPTNDPGVARAMVVSGYWDTFQYHAEISEAETGEVSVHLTAGNAGQ